MGKEKDFFIELMRKFVSSSIYILMAIIAFFIFYKTVILLFLVVSTIYTHIVGGYGIADTSQLGIGLAEKVLNIVTFILVLVKSFKILVSYSKYHHIAIKDLVEISIIALLMEVVFNFGIHPMQTNILFSVLGVALVIVYSTIPYFREKTKKKKL